MRYTPKGCALWIGVVLGCLTVGVTSAPAQSQPTAQKLCPETEFGNVVDRTSGTINALNATSEARIVAKLKRLQAKRGDSKGFPLSKFQSDPKIVAYDREIEDLLSDVDQLGHLTGNNEPTCARLDDLKAKGARLVTVLKEKLAYLDRSIDTALADTPAPGNTAKAPQQKTAALPREQAKPQTKSPAKSEAQSPQKPLPKRAEKPAETPAAKAAAKPAPAARQSWDNVTATVRPATPQQPAQQPTVITPNPGAPGTTGQGPIPAMPPIEAPAELTYSIDEIREVGRGFFGTISVSLANALNYTFQRVGKPTGYILGREGGGAFLAGLRFGKGDLVTKRDGSQKIYWRGPSVGYDLGASGSRTMFLVYNLDTPRQLYKRFTAIDGSAYVGGGVGITFLTDGKLVLAPIRSGVGFRLGASIGYLKLSARPSWNPF